MKKLIFLILILIVSSNLFADTTRVYKRTSDGLVKLSSVYGNGEFPRTQDDDFISLYGALEDYEVVETTDQITDAKTVDLRNGQIQVTKYTQAELDNFPGRKKIKDIEKAKSDLKTATSAIEVREAIKALLDVE